MGAAQKIFIDKAMQRAFDRDGYIKIKLLDQDAIKSLAVLYEKNSEKHDKVGAAHHTSTDTADRSLIIEEDNAIKEVLIPALDRLLCNYKPLVGCFHIKEPGQGTATGMHQDPTFVDDEKYISANVWVALHDIDTTNGNLYFIKGSNRVVHSLRVVPSYPVYYRSFAHELGEKATEIPLKAGEAVIFSNATIHGATDNRSEKKRLAAALLICSDAAQWQLYFNDSTHNDRPIERYEVDLESFITMPKNGKPNASTLKERLNYDFPEVSKAFFEKKTDSGSFGIYTIYNWIANKVANLGTS